jgi:hypothetical protein
MIKTHNYDLYPQGEYDAPWEEDEDGDFLDEDFIDSSYCLNEYADEEDYLNETWDK